MQMLSEEQFAPGELLVRRRHFFALERSCVVVCVICLGQFFPPDATGFEAIVLLQVVAWNKTEITWTAIFFGVQGVVLQEEGALFSGAEVLNRQGVKEIHASQREWPLAQEGILSAEGNLYLEIDADDSDGMTGFRVLQRGERTPGEQ